jgi:co-chaperonin GroES (HSP10)
VPNVATLPVQIDAGNAAASVVTLDQDASVRSIGLDAADTLNISATRTLTLAQNSTFSGVVNNSGALNAAGINVLGASAQLNWSAGSITMGRLQLTDGGTMTLSPGMNKTLKIASNSTVDVADNSKLDVADNKVVVTGGDIGSWNGTNYTGVTGLLQAGRGDGSWNGPGIVTSMSDATTSSRTTLAVALAEETPHAGGTFGGVSVNAGDVLIFYTWGGDADLNGELNGDDYFFIDANVINSGSVFGFHKGDFDYNGTIDGDDYFIIDSNITFSQNSPPFSTSAPAPDLQAVPEPVALAPLLMMSLGLRRRRA